MTTLKRTGIRIPKELDDKLKIIAKRLGYTKNGLIINILWNYLTDKKE